MKEKKWIVKIGLLMFGLSVICNISWAGFQDDYSSHPFHQLYQPVIDNAVRQGLTGLVMLIKTPEEGTWIGAGGYARIEDRTSVQTDSLFCCQSFTKTYTAAAIMLLKDDGLIELDANIDTYLPNDICDRIANGHTATVRQLLYHISGITEGDYEKGYLKEKNNPLNWTWRDELEAAYGKKATFSPGTQCEYTNLNYYLLALIIDQITGNHGDFFSFRIFQTLGMWNTYYKSEPELPRPLGAVDIYFDRYQDGYLENISEVIYEWKTNVACGASGIIASMADHARFMEALFTGQLISPVSLKEMKTGAPVPACNWRGIGIGIIPWTDNQGNVLTTLGGEGSGITGMTKAYYIPDYGITFCFSTNTGSKNETHAQIFNQLYTDVMDAVINQRRETTPGSIKNNTQQPMIRKRKIKK